MPEMADTLATEETSVSQVCLGLCTCPDEAVALSLAELLVERKLAACVNMIPGVGSVYRWQGKVQVDKEVQLLVKTQRNCLREIEQVLSVSHPYDVPEWLVLPVDGGADKYLDWIKSSLK